jgi:hypothetical protein
MAAAMFLQHTSSISVCSLINYGLSDVVRPRTARLHQHAAPAPAQRLTSSRGQALHTYHSRLIPEEVGDISEIPVRHPLGHE